MTSRHKPIIPDIVNYLRQSEEQFELLSSQDNSENADWLEDNFPITFAGRIDWEKVSTAWCLNWSEDPERLSAFERIAKDKQLEGNITIAWGNGLMLPIQIDMEVLKRHSTKIFEEDMDIWICNEQDRWCIELHHDGQVCFGKCVT